MMPTERQLDKALVTLFRIDQERCVPSALVYTSLWQAGKRRKAVAEAQQVYAHATNHGLESHRQVGDLLVSAPVSCGGPADGIQLFQRLSHPSFASWRAIMPGYGNAGLSGVALLCYGRMLQEGFEPDPVTFVSLLKACSRSEDPEEGWRIHAQVVASGLDSDGLVGSSLVDMYAKCGSIGDARKVFDGQYQRDLVAWNVMLAGYSQKGHGEMAMRAFREMHQTGVKPDARTFVSALQGCGSLAEKEEMTFVDGEQVKLEALKVGRELHAEAVRRGYVSDMFVGNTLVSMYAKCGSFADAEEAFDGLAQRNVVSWNAMLSAYAQQGRGERALQIFLQMRETGISPNARTFVSALRACGSIAEKEEIAALNSRNVKVQCLRKGKEIHARVRDGGFESNKFIGSVLVSMYAKCGSINDAEEVFKSLHKRDAVAWNAMIRGYAEEDQEDKALQAYRRMVREGCRPDAQTFVSALHACGCLAAKEESTSVHGQDVKLASLREVRELHAGATEWGFDSDTYVCNSLLSTYAKCGSIQDTELVFERMPKRGVVSWTSMIAAYAVHGAGGRALQVFKQMQKEGVRPDARTLASALHACGVAVEKEVVSSEDEQSVKLNYLQVGRDIHAEAAKLDLVSDVFVASNLVYMYAKCGSIRDAEQVFDGMSQRDAVSWTVMISAYAQEQGGQALQLYAQMQAEGMKPQEATFVSVLQACSSTGAFDTCVQTHQAIVDNGLEYRLPVATCLIHAYSKCGSMVEAQRVFDSLPGPDVISWNALLAGYARLGDCNMSVKCYGQMLQRGLKPDRVTFLGLLSACSHAGLVHKGLEYFETMSREYSISADMEHYACVMDLVGRAGLFNKAEMLLSQMPIEPGLPVWLCLLSACRKHGNIVMGERAFAEAVGEDPEHAAAYVLMSNIYLDAGMLDCARKVDEMRQKAVSWKKPGQSWIFHDKQMQVFLADDCKHQQAAILYEILENVGVQLTKAGMTSAASRRDKGVAQSPDTSPPVHALAVAAGSMEVSASFQTKCIL